MENRKEIAAAISAVMQYIQTEEEAVYMQSLALPPEALALPVAAAPMKLWGMSGRQAQMQMRNLMQMRTFKK
ncbi:hypothetical protein ACFL6B_06625 [Thermodesulfobacteriota bacterium]